MKTIPFLLVLLLAGCSSGRRPVVHVTPHEYLAPSAEPVASGVRDLHADVRAVQASNVRLAGELGAATAAARAARNAAARIEKQGTAAGSAESQALGARLLELETGLLRASAENVTLRDTAAKAEARAAATEKAVEDYRLKVEAQNQKLKAVEDLRVAAVNKAADLTQQVLDEQARTRAAEGHVSRIKSWLGLALGGLLAFSALWLLGLFPIPPPYGLAVRIGAVPLCLAAGWAIVARVV